MRSFISAIVVAVALIGGAIGYSFYVDCTADELHSYTEQIEKLISNGDFDSARGLALSLHDAIEKKKEVLGAIADHQEIYDMQREIDEMVCLIEERETAESRARCAAVSAMIERLSGNSSPAIFNIL